MECVESDAVEVYRGFAERIVYLLKLCNGLRRDLKVARVGDSVLIPVNVDGDVIKCLESYGVSIEIVKGCFERRHRYAEPGTDLRKMLELMLGSDISECISSSIDIVGDIALVEVKCSEIVEKYGYAIAEAVMKLNPGVRSVYAKDIVSGVYRTRRLRFLGGVKKTKTIHREYGIAIVVDVEKSYFNPSLSTEHNLVATEVGNNKVVLDLFTGVGPFALHIAKNSYSYVVACDINRHALELLKESISLNRFRGYIDPVEIDSIEFIESFGRSFDVVIANLPHSAHRLVCQMLERVRVGGRVYLYIISRDSEEAVDTVHRELSKCVNRGDVVAVRKVLDYAPRRYIYRVVIVKKP